MIRVKLSGLILSVTLIQQVAFVYANEEVTNEKVLIESELIKKELEADRALELLESRAVDLLHRKESNVRSLYLADLTKMTIGASGGASAIEKLVPDFDPEELSRRAAEAKICEGEQKELSVETEAKVRSCFINSTEAKGDDISYINSFKYLSSLVDARFRHKCIVSVFGEGSWITAGHCIPEDFMKYDLSVLVDGRFLGLTKNSVRRCESVNCDIAFITLKTPSEITSAFPRPVNTSGDDYRNAKIIISGLQQGKSLTELRSHDEYVKELLWSPVGYAFCRIIKDSNNGCIIHGCSTLLGFSGSPLYQKAKTTDGYELTAVHSGTNLSKQAAVTDGKCEAGVNINYASRMEGEGF